MVRFQRVAALDVAREVALDSLTLAGLPSRHDLARSRRTIVRIERQLASRRRRDVRRSKRGERSPLDLQGQARDVLVRDTHDIDRIDARVEERRILLDPKTRPSSVNPNPASQPSTERRVAGMCRWPVTVTEPR
jgi:hypothetical protein